MLVLYYIASILLSDFINILQGIGFEELANGLLTFAQLIHFL